MRTIIVILFVGFIPNLANAGVLLSRFYAGGGQSRFQTTEQHEYPGRASGNQFSLTLGSPLRSHIDVRAVAAFSDLENYKGSTSQISGTIRSASLGIETKLDLLRQDSRSNLYAFAGIGFNGFWWRIESGDTADTGSGGADLPRHIKTFEDRFVHSFGMGAELRIVRTFGIFIEWRQIDMYPLREGIRLRTITIGLFV